MTLISNYCKKCTVVNLTLDMTIGGIKMKRQQLLSRCLVITLFVLLFTVSCTTVDHQRMPNQQVKHDETNKETLENIFDKLSINIATRFYNFKKNRVLKISLKKISNNLPEELPLKEYIYKNLSVYFKDKHQFAFFPTNTLDLNCIIEIHLVRASTWSSPELNRNNPIELIVLIKDSKDEEIIYSLNKPLVDVVNSQEYLSFKKSFNPSSAESILSATVKKHKSQESNVEKDQYGRPLKDEKGRWITYPDQERKQKPDTASTNYKYSKKASEIRQKEAELNSMVRNLTPGNLDGYEDAQRTHRNNNADRQHTIINGEWDNQGDHYTPAGGGNKWRQDGTFMQKAAGGYIDTKTGRFVPSN